MKTKPKLLLRSETVFRKKYPKRYNLGIKYPIPDLKEFLTYPHNVIVPKHFIDVESNSSELFSRDAQCAADLLQKPNLSNGARQAFVINNLPAKAQEKSFAVLYPEECFNGGGDSDDGSNDEEEPSDSEDNASECEEDIDMDES
jgi:hypothetical protein